MADRETLSIDPPVGSWRRFGRIRPRRGRVRPAIRRSPPRCRRWRPSPKPHDQPNVPSELVPFCLFGFRIRSGGMREDTIVLALDLRPTRLAIDGFGSVSGKAVPPVYQFEVERTSRPTFDLILFCEAVARCRRPSGRIERVISPLNSFLF